jgi:hypothetical protein
MEMCWSEKEKAGRNNKLSVTMAMIVVTMAMIIATMATVIILMLDSEVPN